MKFLIICLIFLVGCTTEPTRQFNVQSDQDQDCLNSRNSRPGYCDVSRYPKGK